MTVKTFSHVAVGVRDMERSLPFYRDVLGLEVVFDQTETITSFGGVQRRGVYLRWDRDPRTPFVVLDQLLSVSRSGEASRPFEDLGVHHFGFWVDDVDPIVERARSAGALVMLEPRDTDTVGYGEAPGGTIRTAIVRDPDGNAVQLDCRRAEAS